MEREVVRLHFDRVDGHLAHANAAELEGERAARVEPVAGRERVVGRASALFVDPAVKTGRREPREQRDVVIDVRRQEDASAARTEYPRDLAGERGRPVNVLQYVDR